MSSLNPLNDLTRTYLDTVAKINKNEEENEIKRWEGELNLQMKTQASLNKESKDESPEEEEEDRKKDDDLAGAPNKNGKNGKKKKRWWDDDGDGKGYEKGEVKEAVYGRSAEKVEASRRKDDDLAGAPLTVTNADKKANTKAYQNYKAGVKGYKAADHMKEAIGEGDPQDDAVKQYVKFSSKKRPKAVKKVKESFSSWRDDLREIVSAHPITDVESEKEVTEKKGIKNKVIINPKMSEAVEEIGGTLISEREVDLQEKQKDTPLQVAAVIDKDRAKKATRDATYDRMHGKNKKADEDERYSKWERYKMDRDAQRAGHPWKHAKGSTTEKEGKKSVKAKHVYDPEHNKEETEFQEGIVGKEVKELQKANKTMKDKDVVKADKTDTPNYKGNKFGVKEAKDWIQGAVKRPGAFTRKAKAAGMSVQAFAKHVDKNKDKYSTRTERQANLAQTFASMKKEDVEEMIYLMIVEDDRLKKWIEFNEGEGHGVSLRGLHLDRERLKHSEIGSSREKELKTRIKDKETQMQQVQSKRWNPKTKKLEKNLGSRPHVSPEAQRNEGYQRNPEEGERKERAANKKYEKVRGERTPMPPRGNKRREEFERWYAANVR